MHKQPQFAKRVHRARARLDLVSPRFKWMFDACEQARLAGVTWQPHIFCTAEAVEELAVAELEKAGVFSQFAQLTSQEQLSMFVVGLMWSGWRMTRGIYRFDETVYEAIIGTEANAKIPMSILRRLPEWFIYIETPGLTCNFGSGNTQLYGVWAGFAEVYGREILLLFPDVSGDEFDEMLPPTIHINTNADTLSSGISIVQAPGVTATNILEDWLNPVINLLLYLCADREISQNNQLVEPPIPQPKKTKKGWRLFPAQNLSFWDVGVRMGAALKVAQAQQQASGDNGEPSYKMRPHIRRAHWQTIVSGKRKTETGDHIPADKRQRELRWLPPVAVNLVDCDELPAVIRTVK